MCIPHACALPRLALLLALLLPASAYAQKGPYLAASAAAALEDFAPWIVENMDSWVVPGMANTAPSTFQVLHIQRRWVEQSGGEAQCT